MNKLTKQLGLDYCVTSYNAALFDVNFKRLWYYGIPSYSLPNPIPYVSM